MGGVMGSSRFDIVRPWLVGACLCIGCVVVCDNAWRLIRYTQGESARLLGGAGSGTLPDVANSSLTDEALYEVGDERRVSAAERFWVLLVAVGPRCPACASGLVKWRSGIPSSQMVHVETWVVTIGDVQGGSDAGGVRGDTGYRMLRLKDSRPDVVYSRFGIGGLPTGLLIRGDGRVSCSIEGEPTSVQLNECWSRAVDPHLDHSVQFRNAATWSHIVAPPPLGGSVP